MTVRGAILKSTPRRYEFMVVFQSCRSEASVPSWMLLYEGPVMLLCEYPKRKLTEDCGSSVRSTSLMRRVVANE